MKKNKENKNPLLLLKKENPLSVPEDYFLVINKRIINKIEINDDLTLFSDLLIKDRNSPFFTPDNYFDELIKKTERRIELGNFVALSKLLGKKNNEWCFTTPYHYFEDFYLRLVSNRFINGESKQTFFPFLFNLLFEKKLVFGLLGVIMIFSMFFFKPSSLANYNSFDVNSVVQFNTKELLEGQEVYALDEDLLTEMVDENSLAKQLQEENVFN